MPHKSQSSQASGVATQQPHQSPSFPGGAHQLYVPFNDEWKSLAALLEHSRGSRCGGVSAGFGQLNGVGLNLTMRM